MARLTLDAPTDQAGTASEELHAMITQGAGV